MNEISSYKKNNFQIFRLKTGFCKQNTPLKFMKKLKFPIPPQKKINH